MKSKTTRHGLKRMTALLLALVLLCAGCGKKQPAQPDQYGLAPEPSKLDGVVNAVLIVFALFYGVMGVWGLIRMVG